MIQINTLLNDGFSESTGFWYKDFTLYPIAKTHIRAVLDFPELFSRNKSDLVKQFYKHNEKIGFEGKARAEIIRGLVEDGWFRIRFYQSPVRYLRIQCKEQSQQKKEIEAFLEYASANIGLQKDDEIRI